VTALRSRHHGRRCFTRLRHEARKIGKPTLTSDGSRTIIILVRTRVRLIVTRDRLGTFDESSAAWTILGGALGASAMGIYDRDYLQDESSRFGAFFQVMPATKTLILVCVAVFLLQTLGTEKGQPVIATFGLELDSQAVLNQFQVWRLITSIFLHEGPFHLLFNMLVLFFIGRILEHELGTREFVMVFLVSGLVGSLAQTAFYALTGPGLCLGASGAVSGLFGLLALRMPNLQVLLFFIIPVTMRNALIAFIVIDVIFTFLPGTTATLAHLGGLSVGMAHSYFNLNFSGWSTGDLRIRRSPRFRVVADEEDERPSRGWSSGWGGFNALRRGQDTKTASSVKTRSGGGWLNLEDSASRSSASRDDLDDQLDHLLAKIARDGLESLTDQERAFLDRASREVRNRRNARR